MKMTMCIAEAFTKQSQLKLFLSLNPVESIDKIIKLVDAGSASVYRVYYRNASLSTAKQGWDEIFAQTPGWFEKLRRKLS